MLTMEQINEIEYFGEAEINGAKYTYKDYMYKSEIRKDGELYARVNNRLSVDDPNRVEYVEGKENKMLTKDGYKVASGMLITKGSIPFEEHAIIVDKVNEDSITYTEAKWDEDAQGYWPTGDGGLMFADEVAEYEFM